VNNIIAQPSYTYTSSANVYFCGSETAELTGSNNLFYSASTPSGTSPASSLTSLTVPTNPSFVNTTTPGPWTYLELLSNSAAIAAGTSTLESNYDFGGNIRPSTPAIGALEYQAIGGTPTNANVSGTVKISGKAVVQ
jgi:hypothetical protein